jgi:hypothetical protein
MIAIINLSVVFLFGAFFGFAELLQRYREIKYTFYWKAKKKNKKVEGVSEEDSTLYFSILYILINGIVSLLSLLLIKHFKGQVAIEFDKIEINNIIIAGLGGMMILRSSLFSIKHKDKQIEIGFATLFQTFLDVVERKMKNSAAALRVCNIYEIMKGIDFNLAKDELPSLCIDFIDNFTEEDSKNLKDKIAKIASYDLNNINKSMQLGREIAYYCDEEILKRSIKKLPHIFIKEESIEVMDEFEIRKLKLR